LWHDELTWNEARVLRHDSLKSQFAIFEGCEQNLYEVIATLAPLDLATPAPPVGLSDLKRLCHVSLQTSDDSFDELFRRSVQTNRLEMFSNV
jgi:hypothetical protein